MYLDFLVKIPEAKGRITLKPKGNAVYVNYEYSRVYDRERKFNIPKRTIIGKTMAMPFSQLFAFCSVAGRKGELGVIDKTNLQIIEYSSIANKTDLKSPV